MQVSVPGSYLYVVFCRSQSCNVVNLVNMHVTCTSVSVCFASAEHALQPISRPLYDQLKIRGVVSIERS